MYEYWSGTVQPTVVVLFRQHGWGFQKNIGLYSYLLYINYDAETHSVAPARWYVTSKGCIAEVHTLKQSGNLGPLGIFCLFLSM